MAAEGVENTPLGAGKILLLMPIDFLMGLVLRLGSFYVCAYACAVARLI